MNSCHNVAFVLGDYHITEIGGGIFRANSKHEIIVFKAECEGKALKSCIISYTDKSTNRCYKATRYLYKYTGKVHTFARQLLLHDYLWDYKNQRPALVSYNS